MTTNNFCFYLQNRGWSQHLQTSVSSLSEALAAAALVVSTMDQGAVLHNFLRSLCIPNRSRL